MQACLRARVPYLDTANYEPPDVAKFEYRWPMGARWAVSRGGFDGAARQRFRSRVTNVFCAHAKTCSSTRSTRWTSWTAMPAITVTPLPPISTPRSTARDHPAGPLLGERRVARDRSPEREHDVRLPEVGPRKAYLLYHEELESLVKHLPVCSVSASG